MIVQNFLLNSGIDREQIVWFATDQKDHFSYVQMDQKKPL